MKTLKHKGVELHKGVYKKVWLEKDVKEAVLEFESYLSQYYNEEEEQELMSESEVLEKFREIFGDWED